jgi:hypothetical protein
MGITGSDHNNNLGVDRSRPELHVGLRNSHLSHRFDIGPTRGSVTARELGHYQRGPRRRRGLGFGTVRSRWSSAPRDNDAGGHGPVRESQGHSRSARSTCGSVLCQSVCPFRAARTACALVRDRIIIHRRQLDRDDNTGHSLYPSQRRQRQLTRRGETTAVVVVAAPVFDH